MKYSVGDRVVHPYHGPGRVASIERKELLDGTKRYYVIDIPDRALILQLPVHSVDEMGLRPAMPLSSLPKVLRTLRSKPHRLPDDFKERQEQVGEKLSTGKVMQVAKVVRDLTWHRDRAHLTRRDTDLLKQGQGMLAAEMALVSGDDISDTSELIAATMTAAVAEVLD